VGDLNGTTHFLIAHRWEIYARCCVVGAADTANVDVVCVAQEPRAHKKARAVQARASGT
jgi:hypothetical protein